MSAVVTERKHEHTKGCCLGIGELSRLNYFYGQMLSAEDFRSEQNFFREKLKLHNRCLHGYGVVCGLLVEPVPMPKECPEEGDEREKKLREQLLELLHAKEKESAAPPSAEAAPGAVASLDEKIAAVRKELDEFYKKHCRKEPHAHLRITCGLAIDCEGNELILRKEQEFDPLEWLSNEDYNKVRRGITDLFVSLCYCEKQIGPVRPALPERCGALGMKEFSKTLDSVRVEVSTTPPKLDERCETCCDCCEETCVSLAKITCFYPGEPLKESQIHNDVRRPITLYQPTTITGINWVHGHTYTQDEAKLLLGTDCEEGSPYKGLEIRFSRPVHASTVRPGVMDVWVIEGGGGRSANIYHKAGHFVDKPEHGWVDRIYYRDHTGETLEPGDRVLIILRADFILDACCRPVDGEHVGGRVPILHEYAEKFGVHHHHEDCWVPPGGIGPWKSGNGTPGGTFESWFYIRGKEKDCARTR